MLQSIVHAVPWGSRQFGIVACSLLMAVALTAVEADAGDWMYRRSYFSGSVAGAPPTPLVPNLRSRWAYRRPLLGTGYGYAARGGYRYNTIYLRSGQSTDVTIIREDWFDLRP